MPRVTNILEKGDTVFMERYQSIGRIKGTANTPKGQIIKVDHYIRKADYSHRKKETTFIKLKNKKDIPKYESFEIYDIITKELKKRKAFSNQTALKIHQLQLTLGANNRRIGQALVYAITHFNHNPKNLKLHPGIGKNTCRQKYWIADGNQS